MGHLGSGQFGNVEQGVWKRQGTRPVDVALKSLTKTSEEDKVKFLQEAAIMAQFRHPNVIMLYGVVVGWNPVSDVSLYFWYYYNHHFINKENDCCGIGPEGRFKRTSYFYQT